MAHPRDGLSIPDRGALYGVTTGEQILDLAAQADASGAFDSIWVGDSLFAKPRLESIVLPSASPPGSRGRKPVPEEMNCRTAEPSNSRTAFGGKRTADG